MQIYIKLFKAGLMLGFFLLVSQNLFAADSQGKPGMHPPMDPGYSGHGQGQRHGAMHRRGKGHHGMPSAPKNIAIKYLRMRYKLNLTGEQIQKLKKSRDKYIEENAVAKAYLKAAKADLQRMIYDDAITAKSIDGHLKKIGKLEGKLWRAFVLQVKTIRAMLTADQKAMLAHGSAG